MPSTTSTNNTGTTPGGTGHGGILGGKGGSTGTTGTTFSWNQPPGTKDTFTPTSLQNLLGYDIGVGLNKGPKVNTNPGYAGEGATTQDALSRLLATSHNPTYAADAQGALSSIGGRAAGNGLNYEDQYFKDNLAHSLNDTATGVNAAFGANGRYGSSGQVEGLNTALFNDSNQAHTQNYQDSINQQQSAAGMLPDLYKGLLAPAQTQLGVGAAQDANAQALLTDKNRITDATNNADYNHIANYLGLLNQGNPNNPQGSLAQTTTTTQNPWLTGLGVAGQLAGIAGMFL